VGGWRELAVQLTYLRVSEEDEQQAADQIDGVHNDERDLHPTSPCQKFERLRPDDEGAAQKDIA
jgi:hypothetical protein